MLPLKTYNALSRHTRKHIAQTVFSHMGEDFINRMTEPFHHNFDYDDGHWYKLMLSHCNYNKAKNIITLTMHIPAE